MATPDMDVIKEIPGYKVIMKAVLKSQIQQLVEQLASHTDEESVILTASVSDGTLSHLGSDSGKFFLDDHEDIKSQFLGFCLKRHHRKKQEKEREEREEAMRAAASQYGMRSPSGPRFMQRSPRMPSPRQPGIHPVALSRASPGAGPRAAVRHEPYIVTRPKRTSLNFEQQTPAPVIKIEPIEGNDSTDSGDATRTPSHNKPDSEREDDAKSNSSSSTIPNDGQEMKFTDAQPAGGLSLDSDFSNLLAGDNSQQSDSNTPKESTSDTDIAVSNIKLEAVNEGDMELEITGVEPGRPMVPQDNWGPNTTGGYDQSGATGSPADMQGYMMGRFYTDTVTAESEDFVLDDDQVPISASSIMDDTERTIPLEATSQFKCLLCDRSFRKEQYLKDHVVKKHNITMMSFHECISCKSYFNNEASLREHLRTEHTSDILCIDNGKRLKTPESLEEQIASHDDDGESLIQVFTCPYESCDQTFTTRSIYEDHISLHTEKFSCFKCGKKFCGISARNGHVRVCTGLVQYKCDICQREFSEFGSLKRHKNAQHLKTTHVCECGMTYRYRSSLVKHKKKTGH